MKIIIDATKQAHTGNCCVCLAPTGMDELAAHFSVFLCAQCANRDDVAIFNAASYEEVFGDNEQHRGFGAGGGGGCILMQTEKIIIEE